MVDVSRRSAYTVLPAVSRSQHVRDQLEAAIERGDYVAGDRLPSERELMELLGVSRVSVREAIRSLQAVGLVEVHQGRGSFVSASRSDRYATSFSHWLSVHRDEVLELLKVRGALDELAAEAAAQRRAPGSGERLADLNAAFRRAAAAGPPADLDELVRRDVAFHDGIAEASGSPLLGGLLRDLHEHINESRRISLGPPGRAEASARQHDAIVAAIDAGDPAAARAAVARHVESVRAAYAEILDATEMEGDA
jgi:DNA-binding FadR family transcriptional regulator